MLDQFRAQKLEWNRANNQIYDRVETSSGDSNGRTLFVQISNGGTVEDLTGATLSLAWNKKTEQGLESFEEVDAKKGQYRLFYPTGMLVNHGVLQASLVLVDVTGRIESKPFDIIVHKGTVDDEAVESDNKFTALTTALVKVSQVQAEFDSLYAEKSLMMDTLHDDKKADMEVLETDYSNRANTLESTYAPRLTEAESEIDMARGGASTLGERLNEEKAEVTAQLAQTDNQLEHLIEIKADKEEVNLLATEKADKSALQNTDNTVALKADKTYVDTQISTIGNASPKGTYATLSALQSAFPSGTTGIYVVQEDGKWYFWNGSAWTAGGTYQATAIGDKTITNAKLADDWAIKSYLTSSHNVFALTEEGNYMAYQAVNCPTNDVSYFIEVKRAKTAPSNPPWVIIEATALNTTQTKYVAHVYGSTVRNWEPVGGVPKTNSIVSSMLSSTYRFRGFMSSVSINTFLDDGIYVATNTCTDFPPFDYWGINKHSSVVEVTRINLSVIEQRLKTTNQLLGNQEYFRTTANGSFDGVPWIPMHRVNLPLFNKNLVLLGDSMTEFGSQHVELWKRTGANTTKLGFGGTRMAVHSNPYYAEFSFFKIAKAIKDNDFTTLIETADTMHDLGIDEYQDIVANLVAVDWTKVDYITVMYMYNDYAGANPIGTQGSYDTSTFIGAFNQGIKDILETYPHIKIYVFSEHWTDSTLFPDVDVNTNSLGLYFRDYVATLKEACERLHIPFFDMFGKSGINKYTKGTYISADGVHPNTKGYELLGLKMSNALVSK